MTSTALAMVETALVSTGELEERAGDYIRKSLSDATHRAHRVDWHQFTEWCRARNLAALPATVGTIVLWLSDRAVTYRPASLERKLASISKAHQSAGYDSPTRAPKVRQMMKGIRRQKMENGEDVRPQKKAPVLVKHIRAMVDYLPETLQGKRDKAVLLIGYAGGFRRSELSNLDMADLAFCDEGVLIRLRYSKTNQDGATDELKDIGYGAKAETCPVRALRAWLDAGGISDGPAFRCLTKHATPRKGRLSGASIARIVKRYAAKVGLKPEDIGAHSLRAGFVTDQINQGTPTPVIMGMTGHRCERVLHGYYRKAEQFSRNLSAAAGL